MTSRHAHSHAAGLFYSKVNRLGTTPVTYRRFRDLAHAVRFAVEEVGGNTGQLTIEWKERDFQKAEILALYESPSYPLVRCRRARAGNS